MKKQQKEKQVPKTVERARMLVIDALASAIVVARSLVHSFDDEDLAATLERMDALLYHEATVFLKLPYILRRPKRKK